MNRLDTHEDHGPAWDALKSFQGALAFNIGANIGQAAKVLTDNFLHVVSFEPCVESFEILAAEMPPNVTPVQVAITDRVGEVTLTESAYSITTGQLTTGSALACWGEKVGERTVKASTVDAEVERYGVPDLIQIDTEGHEVLVLQGASHTLAEHHPPLLIEVHRREHQQPIRDLTPGYEWQVINYDNLRAESVLWDHFWLVGEWSHGPSAAPRTLRE